MDRPRSTSATHPGRPTAGTGARLGGATAIAILCLLLFSPLLLSPHSFPAGGSPGAASRAIADAAARSRWEIESGEVSQLDPDLGGRNRAADPAAFYTHPLYWTLSRLLPGGLSLTLVALLHALLLGLGAHSFFLRLGFSPGTALFSGAVAISSGAAVAGLAAPERLGAAAAAALVPALALVARSVRNRPSPRRVAALAAVVALAAVGGDPPGFITALAFAAAGVWLLERRELETAVAAGVHPGPRRWASALPIPLLALLGSVALGLALASHRALPLLMGESASARFLPGPPWWAGASIPLRLPFFLGAITLVAIAGALLGPRRDPRAVPFLLAAAAAAVVSPAALLSFVGLPIALAAGIGAARLGALAPRWLPVGVLLFAALSAEAIPEQRACLPGRSFEEVASAPRWVRFLASALGPERVAVPAGDGERFSTAFSALGIARAPARPGEGNGAPVREFERLEARYVVTDGPLPGGPLPLVHHDRGSGKHIYLNTSRLGPAYWTQVVESSPRGGVPLPRRRGAIAFPSEEERADLPGSAWGSVRTARRLPSGMWCEATFPGEAYLVFTEPLLPGMAAWVDGRPAPILEANGGQAAIRVPAGRHQARISFRPPGLAAGIAISILGSGAMALLVAAPLLSGVASALARRRAATRTRPGLLLPPPRPAPRSRRREPASSTRA